MLTFLLALLVGLGSLALYMASFFYPEVYRKGDLIWSGVGLFYALVLLVCSDRITGGVLLGQMASVSLIGWFGWQTFNARLGRTPSTEELQSKLSEALQPENRAKIFAQIKQQFSGVVNQVQTTIGSKSTAPSSSETATTEPYKPLTREDFGNPPATVETQAESTATEADQSAKKADVMGTIGQIGQTIGGLFKKPQKNTSTYVRKEFRDGPTPAPTAAEEDDSFGFEEDAVNSEQAVEAKTVPVDHNGDAESSVPSDEIVQEEMAYEATKSEVQPVPPHPPTPDLVEAAIADAEEKHLPADPPEPTDDTDSTLNS
jgi:hypothetical protein